MTCTNGPDFAAQILVLQFVLFADISEAISRSMIGRCWKDSTASFTRHPADAKERLTNPHHKTWAKKLSSVLDFDDRHQ